jgi:hypothetical protein
MGININLDKAKDVAKIKLHEHCLLKLHELDSSIEAAQAAGTDATELLAEKQRLMCVDGSVDQATSIEELKQLLDNYNA